MAFRLFSQKQKQAARSAMLPAPARRGTDGQLLMQTPPDARCEWPLYDALRYTVPVVDAAIRKIVRLTGGFHFETDDPDAQDMLNRFAETVPVNGAGISMQLFADQMLDSLLTYGNAVGELLTDENGIPAGLLTAHPGVLRIRQEKDGSCRLYRHQKDGTEKLLPAPERILFAALDPPAGAVCGVSVLRGLPAVADILLRIYDCIGKNYTRAGNVRYAVTYQPDSASAAFAKDHAKEIAEAWQSGIRAAEYGEVQDFVAVGNVDIKVIGAENQLFDTNVPVRQLLEQIVSKLSIPPFLLGFSWATTERMSSQQADILTSELEYFRRILTPMLKRIGAAVLRGTGIDCVPEVVWDTINLQDETELAEARLHNAQASAIEQGVADATDS